MMLPQRPYFPIGTLHAAVTYPAKEGSFRRRPDQRGARAVGLPQARLAARRGRRTGTGCCRSASSSASGSHARCCTRRDYLFLDEATASLDEPSEAALYRLLEERLPAPPSSRSAIARRSTPSTSASQPGARWRTLHARESGSHERNRADGAAQRCASSPGFGRSALRSSHNQRCGQGWRRTPRCQTIGERGREAARRPAPAPAGTSRADCLRRPAAD